MKLFYRAVDQQGKILKGMIEAKDVKEAALYLRKQELVPIKIEEQGKKTFLASLTKQKTSNADLVFFTRQLSSMLTSGLTLMQALTLLRNQVQNPAMAEVIQGVVTSVEEGNTLSTAISKYPKVFTPIYISPIFTISTMIEGNSSSDNIASPIVTPFSTFSPTFIIACR